MDNSQKKIKIFIFIGVLVLGACRQTRPFTAFSNDFYWESDQSQISATDGTLNIWSGFLITEGAFHSDKRKSSLDLWRRTPLTNVLLKIDYQLEGSSAVFSLPGNKSRRLVLPCSSKFRRIDCHVNLKKGLNLLSFSTKPGSRLVVRGVSVGEPVMRRHLEKGESLTLFPPPGEGELTLAGKGRIGIETTLFRQTGEKKTRREDSTGLFSSTLRIPFSFLERGCLKITSVSGRFNISGYFNRPKPVAPIQSLRFKGKPDVFIFLLDACQASHLGIYGYQRPTSPNIDRLARDATVFESAYANATYTRASVPSFFTGIFPDSDDSFSLAKVTLPQFLNSQGYIVNILSTSFFVSDLVRFPRQGVQIFEYFPDWRLPTEKERIIRRFCTLLESPAPRFTYLHYLEPHLPIVPPPPFRDMFNKEKKANGGGANTFGNLPPASKRKDKDQWEMFFNKDGKKESGNQIMFQIWHDKKLRHSRNLSPEQVQEVIDDYDSSIAYIDAEVGKLLACLKVKNLYDDSLIVIMADHGEALYEHKEWFHGNNVFEETSRVPMIVKFPRKMGLTGRVQRVVQLLDLFPTLADACWQSLPLEGRSLLQAAANPQLDDTLVISRTGHKIPIYGVRWQNWYYICKMNTYAEQLFDLQGNKLKDVHDKYPELCQLLFLRLLERVKGSQGGNAGQGIDISKLPKKEIENLKALGYL